MPVTLAPQPGPQTDFLATYADIAIYGGAAGGGKSFALLLDPCRWYKTEGFRGVIFRRTVNEFKDVLKTEVNEVGKSHGWDYNNQTHRGQSFQLWTANLFCNYDKGTIRSKHIFRLSLK